MRIAIDFGNTHTVVSAQPATQPVEILTLPELAFPESALIPSVVSFPTLERPLIGYQAAAGRLSAPGTFRWMKRYIALNSPYHIRVGTERVSARDAAERFLNGITAAVEARIAPELIEQLTFTVPADSFDDYRDWLKGAFETPNRAVRVVDEISAAAAAANVAIVPGEAVFLIDIGGSTQQTLIATRGENGAITVRGKSGRAGGGSDIDRWLLEEVCRRAGCAPDDPLVRLHGLTLLRACEQLKIALSTQESARMETPFLSHEFALDRAALEALLIRRDFIQGLERMIREVCQQAAGNGVDLSRIAKIFAFGGTTRLPMIARIPSEVFPAARWMDCDPMCGVALGALRLEDGVLSISDVITHEYAIRYRDGQSGETAYRTIVPALTPFPSAGALSALRLKATRPDQRYFGLAIYERSLNPDADVETDPFEVLFDENGAVRILRRERSVGRASVFLNPRAARFIEAAPPADRGETRFSVAFEIDADRFLLVSADDLRTGRRVLDRVPVVRLA